jgi:hypothetical protein
MALAPARERVWKSLNKCSENSFLESRGYQISVTELVGWEHSLKNEFIFAKRVQNHNTQAEMRLQRLLEVFPVAPKFLKSSP